MNSLWIQNRADQAHRPARPLRAAAPAVLVFACCAVLVGQAHSEPPVFASALPSQVVGSPQPSSSQPSAQLLQLAAPIALYPDPLVAQILVASAYPAQIVQASRWVRRHPGLNGQQLANAVDARAWNPSVKALTQFPVVLESMNKNLSWTSALGNAYVNQQEEVLDSIQVLRRRAQTAGRLQSTSQQSVTTQGGTIAIEPANPRVVYVPAYDPWLVYGPPLAMYPGWAAIPGIYVDGPGIYFGAGLGVGVLAEFGWGWDHWGFDWHGRRALYDHVPYASPRFAAFDHSLPDAGRSEFGGLGHGDMARGFAFPGDGFHGGELHGGGGRR